MANFGHNGHWQEWGTPANFNGFRLLAAFTTARHATSGCQPNSASLNRGLRAPPIFGRAAITLGIGPHSSCNSALAGAPESLIRRLQSIMKSAARLIFQVGKYQHVTPLLHELHWLKVQKRIKFRLSMLTYRCLNGTTP